MADAGGPSFAGSLNESAAVFFQTFSSQMTTFADIMSVVK